MKRINKISRTVLQQVSQRKPEAAQFYDKQRNLENMGSKISGLPAPGVVTDIVYATARDGYQIPCKVFTPVNVEFAFGEGITLTDDWLGTILFFHGGGWANGDVHYYSRVCAAMAKTLERRVVSVEYRRSPEHKFPQALHDCYDVFAELYEGKLLNDVNPDHLVLFGDSAGGNLAAAVSLIAQDNGRFMPSAQILLYPATWPDHNPETVIFDSVREYGTDYMLTARDLMSYQEMYVSSPKDYENPYMAPLLREDLAGQPRTLIITAEYCPLRDEGEAYGERLIDDGGAEAEVAIYRMKDVIHGYFLYPPVLPPIRNTFRLMKAFLDGGEPETGFWPGAEPWVEIRGLKNAQLEPLGCADKVCTDSAEGV
ncbi:MAG: alpha/beta hydrolase [Eggerthellaceae bacterium]|nr:alpha/beta hydrolase [Eggerthellaceae bacterium]